MNNRDKLINVASQLFHSFGFQGTSIDMIMKESGVCRSNFYYYFDSKEALGLMATKKVASGFKENFLSKTILNSDLNPLERLDSFYEKAISYNRSLFFAGLLSRLSFRKSCLGARRCKREFSLRSERFFPGMEGLF